MGLVLGGVVRVLGPGVDSVGAHECQVSAGFRFGLGVEDAGRRCIGFILQTGIPVRGVYDLSNSPST